MDIAASIIKGNKDVIALFIYLNFKQFSIKFFFPAGLKYVDVRPFLKKDDKSNKEKDRPISILPNISKVYERLMYGQLYPLMKFFLN